MMMSSLLQPMVSWTRANVVSTGWAVLDRRLPGGGWPLAETVELIGPPESTSGLLLPCLTSLSWEDRWVVLIGPTKSMLQKLRAQPDLNPARFLVVHADLRRSAAALAVDAVVAGTAAAVVVSADAMAVQEMTSLRQALADQSQLVFLLQPSVPMRDRGRASLRLCVARDEDTQLRVQVMPIPKNDDAVVLAPLDETGPAATRWPCQPPAVASLPGN